jgi:hypothetical protein
VTLTIGKESHGAQRQFSTSSGLARAIVKAGAKSALVDVDQLKVSVIWEDETGPVVYPIAKDGRVDVQLAWDME